MHNFFIKYFFPLANIKLEAPFIFIIFFVFLIAYSNLKANTFPGISVSVNKNTGEYKISSSEMNWNFQGSIGHELTKLKTLLGQDALGIFKEIKFSWQDNISYQGTIKWYKNDPVVIFSLILPEGSTSMPKAFPSFTGFPEKMKNFSYNNDNFAPPQFKLNETSTPWLFFSSNDSQPKDKFNAFIISPASDFIVSKLTGDGKTLISSGLNPGIKDLPKNFNHKTILVFNHGIKKTWDTWGKVLRTMYNRDIPHNDADPVLKYFGYWTDNGADYYYNYDTAIGYSKTLLAIRNRYKQEEIPLGYIQLDSWWYEKSIYDYDGKPDADHKNTKLPLGKWNRYGGLMNYSADPFLFPGGLAAFHKEIGIPLVTHNRWIDPHSPYHDKYEISGFAAIDPKLWDHIIKYIKQSGVICYEQDWLNYIYNKSTGMSENLNIGNAFTDGMANACKKYGLSMQYCMAMPRYFLQGLKYNNLTTIRTSGDRFEPQHWKHFLYTTQLGYECGMYPWCDIFKSNELGNMILSVLSAGPVGTGDAIGKEDKSNILMACRKDGVIVKPDIPILPIDNDYTNDYQGIKSPMLAYTYTMHGNITTGYLFAFAEDSSFRKDISFIPSELGIKGEVAIYNPLSKKIHIINGDTEFKSNIPDDLYTYFIIAPVSASGIAFFGDEGKIASTGKQRISYIEEKGEILKIKVLFAKGESSVNLLGYSKNPIISLKGTTNYNPNIHVFKINLPSNGKKEVTVTIYQTNK